MIQHILQLPDGRRIRGGAAEPALLRVELTQTVNTGEALHPGAVCAAMAEISLYAPGESPLAQGDSFTLYAEENGEEEKLGVFIAEQPQRKSANVLTLTAYDRVTLLDRDITEYLSGLTAPPYSLFELAQGVCVWCGVTLGNTELPNGSHPVQPFSASGITGRQLLQWVAEAAGCFCTADKEGVLHLGWYQAADTVYTSRDYYSLSLADYETAPVQRVQLRSKDEDVGTVYPEAPGQKNTLVITGNPLLTAERAEALLPVAQTLFERLAPISYTPCTLTVDVGAEPGSIITVRDLAGNDHTALVMERRHAAGRDTLVCTGPANLQSTTAVNAQSYRALSGRVLSLRTDVEGLFAENADTKGQLAALALDIDGISATVQSQQEENKTAISKLEQTAKEISLSVQSIVDNGVDKVTNQFGLSIKESAVVIHKSGSEMENKLDETGMSVCRGEQVMLRADAGGVTATDVTVNNFLSVAHARFEDYGSDRTACFYV